MRVESADQLQLQLQLTAAKGVRQRETASLTACPWSAVKGRQQWQLCLHTTSIIRGGIIVYRLQLFVYCINRQRINNKNNNKSNSKQSRLQDDLAGWHRKHRKVYQVAGNWLATDAVARDTRKSECL